MSNPDKTHITVLLKETVAGLNPSRGGVYVDGTLNAGGHAAEIFRVTHGEAKVIGIDLDVEAIERAKVNLKEFESKVVYANTSFKEIDTVVREAGYQSVNGILLDLGLSSHQLDVSGRGFTFQKEEPLLMTFKANPKESDVTAYDVVNTWGEENLADIIFGFGEERFARRIARNIIEARAKEPIKTTGDLVKIIESSVPFFYRHGKSHPATKTFQAIRMAVNNEMGALKDVLNKGFALLAPRGRMSIISFHSIEDRMVKRAFAEWVKEGKGILITKKPQTPSDEEIAMNRRSRSAKLRVIEKLS